MSTRATEYPLVSGLVPGAWYKRGEYQVDHRRGGGIVQGEAVNWQMNTVADSAR